MPGLLTETAKSQPPAAFSFVLGTGIVAAVLGQLNAHTASRIFLVLATAALLVLVVGLLWRLSANWDAVRWDLADPARCFGFFTTVAALNLVGTGFYAICPAVTWLLAGLSVPLWLLLSYGLPTALMFRPDGTSQGAARVDGSWFLWVVATQSLSIAAATLAGGLGGDSPVRGREPLLVDAAVALWGVGVLLYLMLTTIVMLRLLSGSGTGDGLVPANWIYMGATAITVLAGARILHLPAAEPLMILTAPVVGGLSYLFWAFGLWWVPMLVIFGYWRHLVRKEPLRYETGLWSIVFPLGMFSVASHEFGAQGRLPVLLDISVAAAWVAVAAWCVVAVAMLLAAASAVHRRAKAGSVS